MKKLLILLILFLISINPNLGASEKLPDEKPEWWNKIPDDKKYELYKEAINTLIVIKEDLENENKIDTEILKTIDNHQKYLEKDKPFYPKLAFFLGGATTIDKSLTGEVFINTGAQIYFLKGRFFIQPGLTLKILDEIGLGVNFGMGFVF